jgi:hypothetical protein
LVLDEDDDLWMLEVELGTDGLDLERVRDFGS